MRTELKITGLAGIAVSLAAGFLMLPDANADSAARAEASAVSAPLAPEHRGKGWKHMNDKGLYSISGDELIITFDSKDARDTLTPYLRPIAAQVSEILDIPVTVSADIAPYVKGECAPRGTISVSLELRPFKNQPGYSSGYACNDTKRHTHYSGHMHITTEWFDSEWFDADSKTNDRDIRNGIAHELGHALGLEHPNRDINGDGMVSSFECLTENGTRPLMCSPNGGYRDPAKGGKFTPMDIEGLRAYVANDVFRTSE